SLGRLALPRLARAAGPPELPGRRQAQARDPRGAHGQRSGWPHDHAARAGCNRGGAEMSEMTWEQAVQWLREQPGQQELVRACYFDDPLPQAAERFWSSAEWKAIASLLPEANGGQALDL